MELNQMIAQLALSVIEAKDKALEWERKEHDRTIHKLIDKHDELRDKLANAEFEQRRLEDLRSEQIAEIVSLRTVTTDQVAAINSLYDDLAQASALRDQFEQAWSAADKEATKWNVEVGQLTTQLREAEDRIDRLQQRLEEKERVESDQDEIIDELRKDNNEIATNYMSLLQTNNAQAENIRALQAKADMWANREAEASAKLERLTDETWQKLGKLELRLRPVTDLIEEIAECVEDGNDLVVPALKGWLTKLRPITADDFKLNVGRDPVNDDLERCNCFMAGLPAHESCGWNSEANMPNFIQRSK